MNMKIKSSKILPNIRYRNIYANIQAKQLENKNN